jgi:hypothetical protein
MPWATGSPQPDRRIGSFIHPSAAILRRVARALIEKAMEGDVSAIKEVADRLDGRVSQHVGGDRKNPVQFQRIERVIVQVEHQAAKMIEHEPSEGPSEGSDS